MGSFDFDCVDESCDVDEEKAVQPCLLAGPARFVNSRAFDANRRKIERRMPVLQENDDDDDEVPLNNGKLDAEVNQSSSESDDQDDNASAFGGNYPEVISVYIY